jgi:hypothetical protein
MPGHERRAGDDEAEGDEAGADLDRARADRLVEDEDAADDGGEVGGHGGEAITSTAGPSWRLRAEALPSPSADSVCLSTHRRNGPGQPLARCATGRSRSRIRDRDGVRVIDGRDRLMVLGQVAPIGACEEQT